MRCKATTHSGTRCKNAAQEESDYCYIESHKANPVGRPLMYDDKQALEASINNYFDSTEKPTQSGLSLFLGFNSRQSLYNYKERPEFLDSIKKAFTRIDSKHEERLYGKAPTGSIFYLKSRGWEDGGQSSGRIDELIKSLNNITLSPESYNGVNG